ncbi:MAG: porin, partial [Burkholderiales bacterium]
PHRGLTARNAVQRNRLQRGRTTRRWPVGTYQCASTADLRGESQNGFCSRNSALGLKGGFGSVFIGNWDTPFKRTTVATMVSGNDLGIWAPTFLLTGDSTTDAVGANRASFRKRQQNSINYDSPNSRFQAMGMFSSSQPSTGTTISRTTSRVSGRSVRNTVPARSMFRAHTRSTGTTLAQPARAAAGTGLARWCFLYRGAGAVRWSIHAPEVRCGRRSRCR